MTALNAKQEARDAYNASQNKNLYRDWETTMVG